MPGETRSWFCDTCGSLIKCPDHGWVEWIDLPTAPGKPLAGRDIRIVHAYGYGPNRTCQFNSNHEIAKDQGTIGDACLNEFRGPTGLTRLLAMVAEREIPKNEMCEIIQRIHIPGYEYARKHFERAIKKGVLEGRGPYGYFTQEELDQVLVMVSNEQ